MKMNEQQLQHAREQLQPYVNSITTKSRGKNMYVCPICKSGTGTHKTGAFSIDADNPTKWKCFSCNKGGDIFDLIGEVEGITDTGEQFKRAAELFNIDIEKDNKPMPTKTDIANSPKIAPQEDNNKIMIDFTQDIEKASQNLNISPTAKEYLHSRGITDTTISKYKLGYCPTGIGEIKENHKELPKNSLDKLYKYVFPIESIKGNGKVNYYQAGLEDRTLTSYSKYINPALDKPIFNETYFKNPPTSLYIVEGILDALSIEQEGGKAIALLGSDTQRLYTLIEQYSPKDTLFVIATDNDKQGKEAAINISKKLSEMGYQYTINHPTKCKDANELLIQDKEAFTLWANTPKLAEILAYETQTAAADLIGLEERIKERGEFSYCPTGYKSLDYKLDGGLYAGLYIVGAISSQGKTTQVLQIADQLAERGHDILFISLEQSKYELMVKSISRITYLLELTRLGYIDAVNSTQSRKPLPQKLKDTPNAQSLRYIMNTKLQEKWSKETIANVKEAKQYYAKNIGCRTYIKEGVGNITVGEIREYVKKHREITGRTPIVVIDYLQILAPADKEAALGSDKRITDANVSELKQLSRDYNIPILAISSFNRENYNSPVSMSSFKESGAIEYSSDILFGIQATGLSNEGTKTALKKNSTIIAAEKKKEIRTLELVILKNRNGQMKEVNTYFKYTAAFNCFLEVTPQELYQLENNRQPMEQEQEQDLEPIEKMEKMGQEVIF